MLEIIDLHFEYHQKPLLQGIHFQVNAGDLLHICGKNGAGKTTLLRLVAGIFEPDAGKIYFQGQAILHNQSAWQEQICFVGHKSGMHPGLTVAENLYFDLQSNDSTKNIHNFLQETGLGNIANRLYGALSAGQQKRVALLRPCLSKATIWLLDEPLVALDTSMVDWFIDKIRNHQRRGGYVLLTSHQILPDLDNYQEYNL